MFATATLLAAAFLPGSTFGATLRIGQQDRWQLSFRAELQNEANAPPAGVVLSGEWLRTVVAVRPADYDVQFQLASARIEGNRDRKVDQKELSRAEERLSRPFWVTCGNDGTLRMVHFPKDVSPSDRNLLQTLATETQFVQSDATHPVWTSMERDGGGSYLAIYQKSDASHVRKKKLKYVNSGTGGSGASTALSFGIEESEVDFSFTPAGAVAAVDGVQRVRMGLPGANGNAFITRFEIHLKDLREIVDPTLAGRLAIPKGVDDAPVTTHQPDPRVAREEMDRQNLAGQSTEAILSAVARNDSDGESRLAALFRRRPESIPVAVARLAGGTAETRAIASGLAEAGTNASFGALRGIAQDVSRAEAVRVSALVALAGAKEPSIEAMRAPVNLLDDHDLRIREAARLAAGALARAGRGGHAAESDAIEATLASRFSQAATPAEKKDFMAALGNSAGPRAKTVIAASLKDTREDVRAAAARGLRLVPGAATDDLLATTATKDTSAAVRGDALLAISFRLPLTATLWEAVLKAAQYDSAEVVRTRAISMLRNDANRPPEAEATLDWIAQHDSVEAVRRYAGESLTAVRASATRR